jgi:branched-chain amino acid transport system ATP-binding protein
LIEQNARLALHISDRAYVMVLGRITLEGNARELAQAESVQKSYMGA